MAVAAGFPMPSALPTYLPMIQPITLPPGQWPPKELVSTNNPLVALQHPGYYYYTAANCTVQRRDRFATALAEEESATKTSSIAASPGFPNEKKIDHAALIIEASLVGFAPVYRMLTKGNPPRSFSPRHIVFSRTIVAHNFGCRCS